MRISLARVKAGKPAKSILMVGLRGVGKTVRLNRIRPEAEQARLLPLRIEAPGSRSRPSILARE